MVYEWRKKTPSHPFFACQTENSFELQTVDKSLSVSILCDVQYIPKLYEPKAINNSFLKKSLNSTMVLTTASTYTV